MTKVSIYNIFLALILAATHLTVGGRTLSVSTGEIASGTLLSPDERTLTIEGSVNAADLHAIATLCRSLESLDLSDAVIASFSGKSLASNHTSFAADELPAFALSGLTAKKIILPRSLRSIADGALLSAAIEEIEIPTSVTHIGSGAFADCRALKKVTIPSTVASLGSHCFKGCSSLKEVTCDVAAIPDEAFADSPKLRKVSLGGELTEIGAEAFNGCTDLSELTITDPARLTSIGTGAFAATSLSSIDLTPCTALNFIGSHAFAGCSRLSDLRLPASLTTIGEGCFADCASLSSLSIPQGITMIPALALKGAVSMTDVSGVLHDKVTTIGPLAFAGINSARQVTLPAPLTSIGSGAFEGWTALGKVIADRLSAVPALGSDVWLGVDCPSTDLLVNEEIYPLFTEADQWRDFNIIIYSSSLPTPSLDKTDDTPLFNINLRGGQLTLTSARQLASVALFDIKGAMIYGADAAAATSFSAQVPVSSGSIYIVSARFTDSSAAAAKVLASD